MVVTNMTETEHAIQEIRECLASIKVKLDNIGPRIGEATLCKLHTEKIDALASKINVWTGAISVLSFILGILVPTVIKHIFP